MNFIRRSLLPALLTALLPALPLLLIALTFAAQASNTPEIHLQTATSQPPTITAEEAGQKVQEGLRQAIGDDVASCWEDPGDQVGREPASAVVKWDGTTDVERVPASHAMRLASDGQVWVLAWCSSPAR